MSNVAVQKIAFGDRMCSNRMTLTDQDYEKILFAFHLPVVVKTI